MLWASAGLVITRFKFFSQGLLPNYCHLRSFICELFIPADVERGTFNFI